VDENGKKFPPNATNNKKEDNVPNIIPISYRTRSTTSSLNQILKPPTKAPKKLKPIQENEKDNNKSTHAKNKSGGVDEIVTTLKSKHSIDAEKGKLSITSRRISNEFEKTEESLYVSALEDIPSDASRLSYEKVKSKTVLESCSSQSSEEGPLSTSSNSLNLSTTLLSSDSDDVFEDVVSRKLPPGTQHFDRENWNDHFQVSHYSMNIFEYLKQREFHYKIRDYMSEQPDLSKWMRSLLVDWMVEVQESFELNHETLYLAIKIVDTYLGRERIAKDTLQLLGAAALLIACKYDVSHTIYSKFVYLFTLLTFTHRNELHH
jgi:G2/mitotic-specific cyclin-B3